MSPAPGRLIIIAGLPGTGKTTLAHKLAATSGGTIFSADDWLQTLQLDLWDSARRDRIEGLQWQLAQALIGAGGTAIIEWGSWGRSERDTLRDGARALGARVEMIFLDAPLDIIMQRLAARGREQPPIRRDQLEDYAAIIQRPTPEEFALFDPSSEVTA